MNIPDMNEKIPLPAAFLDEMNSLFADEREYNTFLKSYDDSPAAGLRLNPWKGPLDELLNKMKDMFSKARDVNPNFGPVDPFQKETVSQALFFSGDSSSTRSTTLQGQPLFSPVPWEPDGFYYDPVIRPGKHPFHEMGIYYIQEPSAMSAVPVLDPQPGERILDLCAAPGGKTTQIAGRMLPSAKIIMDDAAPSSQMEEATGRVADCGLLISNEIHPARAKILSQNVERMGLSNVLVTNETPERLAARFPAYFDRILVDAPCSGEGMFRKHPEARLEWSPGEVTACADRQRHLLDLAASMLRPGGRIVYSTCTFSKAEDEGVVESFLAEKEEFHLVRCERFFPHRQRGEGHFVAVLDHNQIESGSRLSDRLPEFSPMKDRQVLKLWEEFLRATLTPEAGALFPRERLLLFGEQLYLAPEYCPKLDKLKVLRPGLHLGTLQKGRLTPSHALALFLKPEDVKHPLSLAFADERVAKYFAGDVIPCEDEHGWTLVCVEGFSAGWGKASGGVAKNHYPKALRKAF